MEIIKEESIQLKNGNYKKITFSNGEKILKRFDEEFKVWIILKFKESVV
jgi:hypothetical protein